MKYYNKNNRKEIVLVALLVAIVGMSLGFAAFSETLSISSSASVTPNSEEFKFVMSASATDTNIKTVVPLVVNGATADNASISDNPISIYNINASFTEPGQAVSYTAYTHNIGKYKSYIKGVYFDNVSGESVNKKCVASGDTTQALVDEACKGIKLMLRLVNANGFEVDFEETTTGMEHSNELDINNYTVGELIIFYDTGSARADGPFNVQFGNVRLELSSSNA